MSIWKEIKHALNSTIGTNGFLSLDKIVGQKQFAVDDNIQVLLSYEAVVDQDKTVQFTPQISGTVKVYFAATDDIEHTCLLYVDTPESAAVEYQELLSPNNSTLDVVAGNTYRFVLKKESTNYLPTFTISASVITPWSQYFKYDNY